MITDAKQLRILYSQRDFQLCLSALDFLSEADFDETYSYVELRRFRCYLDMAAISYCRPFNKSEGMPILSTKAIQVKLSETERNLHQKIIHYRNKIVAHSDASEVKIGFHTYEINVGDKPAISMPQIRYDEGLEIVTEYRDILAWMTLVRKLMQAISKYLWEIAQNAGPGKSFIKSPDRSN